MTDFRPQDLDLPELERLAAQATDPGAFSLYRQSARATLREKCTVEVITALLARIRALERERDEERARCARELEYLRDCLPEGLAARRQLAAAVRILEAGPFLE